ncbi:MAG: MFS transporter [Lautropia sp.]|nr:MFS transporter [Lautropia sp.]
MKIDPKLAMTFRQILLMNFGFFGIQYSFGLQQTAINPVFAFLKANPENLPLLNLAGPVTGLIIQPLIGALSDRTWVPGLGRRRPYFLIGAIGCSICLFLYPHSTALWMAVLLLWLLDASNNTAMEPYRAFIADKLPPRQHATGFLMQSFFTGLGITLANVSLYFFQQHIQGTNESGIPYWVFGSFYVGAFCSIVTVLISVFSTPENPPTEQELAELRAKPHGLIAAVKEIAEAIGDMPKTLWQLALVYMFQWYAMFIYWQYVSLSIAQSVWGGGPDNPEIYQQAVGWTGLVNGFYNIVTFVSAFGLMYLARKYQAKVVHAAALALAAVALCIFPSISNKYLLFVPMIGFGIAWASIMGVPYLIAVAEIPKERYGVYMGIINMMIVIPMLIETLTFGWVYSHLLGHNPGNAMMTAGVLLGIAAVATLLISTPHAGIHNMPMTDEKAA